MSQPLRIRFDTDVEGAKAKVANLVSNVAGSMAQLNATMATSATHVSRFQAGMEALPAPIRTAVDAFIAFEAVKAVAARIGDAFEDASGKIEKMLGLMAGAERAGVGTTFFQGFVASAGEVGLSADQATAILNRAREASTVRIGEGGNPNQSTMEARLGEHQAAGNLTSGETEAYRTAADTEAKIRAALDLIEHLNDEGKQLAALDIGRAMFGDDFERKLRDSVDIIGKMREALNGMTVAGGFRIPTPEELAKVDEFKRKNEEIKKLMGEGMAPIEKDILAIQNQMTDNWLNMELAVAKIVKRVGEIYVEFKKFLDSWGLLPSVLKDGQDAGGPLVLHIKPRGARADTSRPLPKTSTSEREPADAVEDLIRNLAKARDVEQAELDTLGKSNLERTRAVDLAKAEAAARSDYEKGRRDSPNLDEDERRRLLAVAESGAKVHDNFVDVQQALGQAAERARYFGSTLSDAIGSAIVDGNKLGDVLQSVVKTLEKSAIQGLIMGTGPFAINAAPASAGPNALGGALGAIGGLFRANGGDVYPGRAYTVGELGREIFMPNETGRMVPVAAGGGVGGGVVINVHNQAGAQVDAAASPRPGGGFDVNVMVRELRRGIKAEDARVSPSVAQRRG